MLPVEDFRRWKDKFGTHIYQGCGATETCGGVTMVPMEGEPPEDTVGTILADNKIKIVDPESIEELPSEEEGELLVHSEAVANQYWNKEEETRECFLEIDGLLW